MEKRLGSDFKRFFIRGLAAFLPTVLTIWIIVSIVTFVQTYMGSYINTGVKWLICKVVQLASDATIAKSLDEFWQDKHLNWFGFLLAIGGIYFFGKFIASFVGRAVWRLTEHTFLRLPIIKQIYPYIKQVTDFLLSERKVKFTRVVAVEYPRKGIWSLGLVTGAGMKTLKEAQAEDLLTVFIPSSPTPVTGYTITVKRDDVIDISMTFDEALRFTVSGGVIMPSREQVSEEEMDQARYKSLPGSDTEDKSA